MFIIQHSAWLCCDFEHFFENYVDFQKSDCSFKLNLLDNIFNEKYKLKNKQLFKNGISHKNMINS